MRRDDFVRRQPWPDALPLRAASGSGPSRWVVFAAPILIGAAFAGLWISLGGGRTLVDGMRRAHLPAIASLLAMTAVWVFLRFIRWQFLLRRAGIRLPIRPSFHAYLAALPGTATPAYVGEAIRAVFIRRRFGVPVPVTISVLVIERLYDVAALAVIAVATTASINGAALGVAFLFLAFLAAIGTWRIARRAGVAESALRKLREPGTTSPALALSLAAWGLAALMYAVAASAIDVRLPMVASARVYANATLFGGLTLLPAGIGATGSLAIIQLTRLGIAVSNAVLVVSITRLFSTGATLTVGSIFLWRELSAARTRPTSGRVGHFDAIATEYEAQWSPHVWNLLLDRKLGLISAALPPPPAGLGLDLGCGLGTQCAEMNRRGYRVLGVDPAVKLLRSSRARGCAVAAGSAVELPFRTGSLDFVYAIGVLHHLAGPDSQRPAYREIARVLKPGGVLLVLESNPHNPLFRFYMGYVFPMIRQIDEGTESWLNPDQTLSPSELALERVTYFTFLPDFTPRFLMGPAMALERLLERGPTRTFSAHYMALLRRT